jgi:hypothetical protein
VINAMFWTGVCAWILERVGWIPDQPVGLTALGSMVFLGKEAITLPFRRRPRPLLLPGTHYTPLAELLYMPAESHVHVRGRICARERMPTYLGDIADAVYSRVELVGTTPKFAAHRDFRAHHVETRDFLLADDTGATVEIRMCEAEVKLPRRTLYLHDDRVVGALLDQLRLSGPRPIVSTGRPSLSTGSRTATRSKCWARSSESSIHGRRRCRATSRPGPCWSRPTAGRSPCSLCARDDRDALPPQPRPELPPQLCAEAQHDGAVGALAPSRHRAYAVTG